VFYCKRARQGNGERRLPYNRAMPEATSSPAEGHRSGRSPLGLCPCCRRRARLTFHHLIPRKLHRRPHYRRRYSREHLHWGVFVCRRCHSGIHRIYDEQTLAKRFASLPALQADEQLRRHFRWVAKQREQFD
jgi:hypothetical protein